MIRRRWSGISALLLLTTAPLAAVVDMDDYEKQRVESSAIVKQWCQKKSAEYFKERKITPYNWSASWWDEENSILVEGEWRVESRKALVSCRAERGTLLKHAVMTVEFETPR